MEHRIPNSIWINSPARTHSPQASQSYLAYDHPNAEGDKRMRLVQATTIGSVDDYHMVEAPIPRPRPDEVLVKVMVCGMGYVDALVAVGGYQVKPTVPFTAGQEISGVVEAVGTDVTRFRIGDRVIANLFGGGLAEYLVADQAVIATIPDKMTFAQAAGFRINYITALHALRDRARLQPGERLLVFGAAGGVGSAAVQVGRLLGAHVIAVGSSETKRKFALEIGAQTGLDTEAEGWRDRLKAAGDGSGPDVIFDPVAGPLFEPAFRSLAWRGRHLVIGFTGGPIPKLPINLPLMKGASLVGVDVRQFLLYESDLADRYLDELLDWVAAGKLVPPVGREFRFDEFAEAMRFAMSGQGLGKSNVHIA
jgi:NADPH:quinone reductase